MQDVVFGHGGGLLRDIRIEDTAARGGEILQVGNDALEAVLHRTEITTDAVNLGQGLIHAADGGYRIIASGDIYIIYGG